MAINAYLPIEELVHTADGELISKDPLKPFVTPGTRVRMIDELIAKPTGCEVPNNAEGTITSETARMTEKYRNAASRVQRVVVEWDNHPNYWCPIECVEVI